jgi:hypothetical protein
MGSKLNGRIMGNKINVIERGEVSSSFLSKALDGNDLIKKVRSGDIKLKGK